MSNRYISFVHLRRLDVRCKPREPGTILLMPPPTICHILPNGGTEGDTVRPGVRCQHVINPLRCWHQVPCVSKLQKWIPREDRKRMVHLVELFHLNLSSTALRDQPKINNGRTERDEKRSKEILVLTSLISDTRSCMLMCVCLFVNWHDLAIKLDI